MAANRENRTKVLREREKLLTRRAVRRKAQADAIAAWLKVGLLILAVALLIQVAAAALVSGQPPTAEHAIRELPGLIP